ncbi:MAG: DUF3696 domain-containing protein [bacterium]|nr:DUF3696 domain-containing protein [bacterium]
MFTEMRVNNFKSWPASGSIRLEPVTAFFGTNSSGKTSLLQALLLLKQSAESVDRRQVLNLGDGRSLISLGLMTDIFHNHDPESRLEFAVSWNDETLSKELRESVSDIELGRSVNYSFNTQIMLDRTNSPYVQELVYVGAGIHIKYTRLGPRKGYDLKVCVNGQHDYLMRHRGRPSGFPPPSKYYGFPDESFKRFQNADFLSLFELSLQQQFDGVYYLGPLRRRPDREYRWQGSVPSGVGVSGERTIEALLASETRPKKEWIARKLRKNGYPVKRERVQQVVREWLQELELVETFDVERIAPDVDLYKVMIQRTPDSAMVLLPDVGFGVSQVLPVLGLLASVPEGSVVILEQPELHLHPSVQSGLADIILETTRVRRAQVIVESHSEHLLTRIQRRIAEEKHSKESVALYFCAQDEGRSRIEPLGLDEFGRISNWPRDFFGDLMGEAGAIVEAGVRRSQR